MSCKLILTICLVGLTFSSYVSQAQEDCPEEFKTKIRQCLSECYDEDTDKSNSCNINCLKDEPIILQMAEKYGVDADTPYDRDIYDKFRVEIMELCFNNDED